MSERIGPDMFPVQRHTCPECGDLCDEDCSGICWHRCASGYDWLDERDEDESDEDWNE